jgi:manganese-dependent inorganic pyrophosphatase
MLNEPVRNILMSLSRAPSRCLPVGGGGGNIAGVIFEGDLAKEPNVELILVDHNELSQAVEGAEHYHIREVIDHHRLGIFSTRYPITFINRVVGATCTIITSLYREQRAPIEKDIASILLCGILADTLGLKSATTTDTDRETAAYLSTITGLDIARLTRELQEAANRINARPAEELIGIDMKEYADKNVSYSVSQVETDMPDVLVARAAEIFDALEKTRSARDYLFAALLVTDVTVLDSLLFVAGKKSFLSRINFPRLEGEIYILKDIVSRKKQLIPLLSELIEQTATGHPAG